MKHVRYFILFLLFSTLVVALIKTASGFPASSFTQQNGDWYDNWGIDRNDAGVNGQLPGYLPNIASETLGENKELAHSIGQQFLNDYPSKTDRAVAILKYVQTWTYYAYDSDTFFRNGVAQEEWAQNADEFAHAFNQSTGVKAPGDCEDMAFLCGTVYVSAGFDAAVVDATDHCALLIWLPEFSNANDYWDLNDGRGSGWIWVEATGSSNPLGWTPSDFEDGAWTAYQINSQPYIARTPASSQSPSSNVDYLGIGVVIIISIILALIRQRRAQYFKLFSFSLPLLSWQLHNQKEFPQTTDVPNISEIKFEGSLVGLPQSDK
jgi:hypothetical protein